MVNLWAAIGIGAILLTGGAMLVGCSGYLPFFQARVIKARYS